MPENLKDAFELGLNQHGYAFQQRVIREVLRLKYDPNSKSKWSLLAIEQPVAARNGQTRIDILLQDRWSESNLSLILAECKRVNPAFSDWCFAKGSFQEPPWVGSQVICEVLALDDEIKSGGCGSQDRKRHIYDIGFSIKSDKDGDKHPVSNDKDAVESACQQVCRGLNGLIEELGTNQTLARTIRGVKRVDFMPVIFTTARLLTCNSDLSNADLVSGDMKLTNDVTEREWLYYQYPQSPGIHHTLPPWVDEDDSWSFVVGREYFRSIAIVSAKGIQSFLSDEWPHR